MAIHISPSATSVILLLMAVTSLLIMLSLNQINYMVHGDLYNFGLQFSYRWAMPYWILSGIVFGLSWTNIAVSIVFTLYIQKKRRTQIPTSALAPQTERTEAMASKADETKQRRISEFLEARSGEPLSTSATVEERLTEQLVNANDIDEPANSPEPQLASEEAELVGQIVDSRESPIPTPASKEDDKQNPTIL